VSVCITSETKMKNENVQLWDAGEFVLKFSFIYFIFLQVTNIEPKEFFLSVNTIIILCYFIKILIFGIYMYVCVFRYV